MNNKTHREKYICHIIHSIFTSFSLEYHLYIHWFFTNMDSIDIGGIDMKTFYLYMMCFILLASITFAGSILKVPIYRYNKDTGLWELKRYENVVEYPVILADSEETAERSSEKASTKGAQWYYSIEYIVKDSKKVDRHTLWADQKVKIGEMSVWNDKNYIYVAFKVNDWLLKETNLMVLTDKPTGNFSPGSFPYTTKYDTYVKKTICSIPLNWQKGEKVYILAHALIVKVNSDGSVLKSKDAWCGESDPYMELNLSATKVTWFLKKSGEFFAKVLEGAVTSSHQIVMSFSSFANPKNGDDQVIPTFYAFSDRKPDQWIPASNLNGMEFKFSDETTSFNMWQKVQLDSQSASVYRNKGVITFTICNVKVYTGD